jgi:hypothetical protein
MLGWASGNARRRAVFSAARRSAARFDWKLAIERETHPRSIIAVSTSPFQFSITNLTDASDDIS